MLNEAFHSELLCKALLQASRAAQGSRLCERMAPKNEVSRKVTAALSHEATR